MNFKYRCVAKYILRRFLPNFLIVGTLSAMPIYMLMAEVNLKTADLVVAIALLATVIAVMLGYYTVNIAKFLQIIKQQENQYHIQFENAKSELFTKYSLGIICSRNWLIQPGKLAIYRKSIQSASIIEERPKGGILYSLRIKTHSGKSFIMKFRNKNHAKALRKWARQ